MVMIKFKKLSVDTQLPTKGTKRAAAFDVYLPKDYRPLPTGQTRIVPLDFSIQPPTGYCTRLIPRSGLASRGLQIANSPALIDEDYTGEVGVILYNTGGLLQLNKGDRICQLMVEKVVDCQFEVVEELVPTERGNGAYGSTGN